MPDKSKAEKSKVVSTIPSVAALQTSNGTYGTGAPTHTPSSVFQTYTDTLTGKTYLWTGDKWS